MTRSTPIGEADVVEALNRRKRKLVLGHAYSTANEYSREERNRAGDYLSTRMMLPGGAYGELGAHVERELDQMTPSDRVFLEIEMARKEEQWHSFDYDPCQERG